MSLRVPEAGRPDGPLYAQWAARTRLRVKAGGAALSENALHKAAAKAVVPLRNKQAGGARMGASILTGARRKGLAPQRQRVLAASCLAPVPVCDTRR